MFRRCAPAIALALALMLPWLSMAAGTPALGLVSLADGEPFTLIRGYRLLTASTGVTLLTGDIIETRPGNLLVVELAGGAVAAIGPSSQVYLLDRSEVPTLVLLRGWVKLDTLAAGNPVLHRVLGVRLGAASQAGTFLVHAGDAADEIYHESGSMDLIVRTGAGSGPSRASQPNEFFVRSGLGALATRPGPDATFIAAMPVAFRDPLPHGLSRRFEGKGAEPKLIGAVGYDDVSAWLAMPRDLRRGFVERFEPRLKDPAFVAALDAHMGNHPEWEPVAHPPSASDRH
jgi:hypothetical protein